MIPRYTLPEMGALWSDQARFERMLEVEIAVCRAQVRRGLVPARPSPTIEAPGRVDVERIAEIERPPTTTSSPSSARSPRPSGPRAASSTSA